MGSIHQSIVLLPLEVQAQIRSSVQITSLSDVVLELVKNSLDANANHVDIQLDFLKGYCAVLDNGAGILKSEFLEGGGLAQLYHTSRLSNRQHSFGRYGRFLASLSSVSLLSITSCHLSEGSINSKTLKDGQTVATGIDIDDEEISKYSHGTRVVVHNLFGRMPVRVRYRVSQFGSQHGREKEFSGLKQSLVGLVLAASRCFSLDVRNNPFRYLHKPDIQIQQGSSEVPCELQEVVSTLFQAGLLDSVDTDVWRQVCARSSGLIVRAFFCLEPAPSRRLQYISLNRQPLPSANYSMIYDQINTLFDQSAFGTVEQGDGDAANMGCMSVVRSSANTILRGRKQIDRWPVFYISIVLDAVAYQLHDSVRSEADMIMSLISGSLGVLVTEFLQTHGFKNHQPTGSRENRQKPSDHLNGFVGTSSNFDNWSRIKSGNSTTSDLLDGLPFIAQGQQKAGPAIVTERIQDGPGHEQSFSTEDAVLWKHPRTGNILSIDPRTGMIIPQGCNEPRPVPNEFSRVTHHRKLSDVVDSLRDYFPSSRVEQSIKSLVLDLDSVTAGTQDVIPAHSLCICDKKRQLCFEGLTSAELASPSASKVNLKNAKVLGQVDGKFVLASAVSDDGSETSLFLVDQHAADERIRVEDFFHRFCSDEAVQLTPSITFEVNSEELKHLQRVQTYFAQWQIHYSVLPGKICVSALPGLIIERCRSEPKLLINILRREIWQDHIVTIRGVNASHWLDVISGCPQGILDILASRACRTAIMFNDKLTLEQCQELVQRLAMCFFPFRCAHGRPSWTVVARYRDVGISDVIEGQDSSFGIGWKAWHS